MLGEARPASAISAVVQGEMRAGETQIGSREGAMEVARVWFCSHCEGIGMGMIYGLVHRLKEGTKPMPKF